MKTEEFKNAYPNPPEEFHNAVLSSLYKLDNKSPVRYRNRRTVRFAVVCAVVIALGSFTAVASATGFFGLFSEPVGKFGLHVGVTEETTSPLKHVKMVFGYMTKNFSELPHMEEDVKKFQNQNGESFSFSVVPAKDYDFTETYIIDSEETTMYFEDWGYVVGGGAYGGADKEELLKIMKSLSLVENTNFVPKTTSADMVMSDLDKKRSEYDRIINSEVKMHKLGEAFNWDRESASDAFTVKVTSIKEQSDTSNIPEEYWSWITDYSLIHSDFFDENGQLITPYTRHDIKDSDGVNTQRNEWDTEVDRHFYVVTVEITQNSDKEFDVFGDFSPVVLVKDENGVYHYNGTEDQHGITQSVLYGNVDTVLSTPGDEVNMLHLSKGETRTLTYGIVADDNILDNAYLSFYSRGEDVIDDNAETITISDHSDCVKIKK